ncbi:HAD superfamily hydrolase (TIGR01509 family) [Natronoflexus pectinivorans]|uniref:HAD superfamily hydrolase (TIGR01509 family) n=2 Tax=Natronoflexus pectinivorans TaxID=682526 RepID=A0A4R2GMG6_9BACT|nr:HAD superfamily hydrolase (TIGR01509 family) [Natronoflexus pectinivorans]
MDGVMYDSMPNHASTWVESFRRSGINFPEYDAYLNEGRTGPATINIAFEKYGNRPATEEDIKTIYDTKTELMQAAPEAPIMPGMQEVVKRTIEAGLLVVIVTGSRQPSLLARLESDYGITRENVINGFDVKKGKPDPEPYLMALKKVSCKANEAIVIENAPMGVESSVAANITTIAVNTGILKPEVLSNAGASVVLSGTEELLKNWETVTGLASS